MKKNKKGVSIVIGYVLLVVVAISLSLLVYAWLKGFLPGQIESCPDAVSLIISDYNCENGKISLTLKNQGLFNLYGFIARVSNVKDGFFYDLKENNEIEHYFLGDFLEPNEKEIRVLSYPLEEIAEIQIEPFILGEKGDIVLCDNAIIRQELEDCGGGGLGPVITTYYPNSLGCEAWYGKDNDKPPNTFLLGYDTAVCEAGGEKTNEVSYNSANLITISIDDENFVEKTAPVECQFAIHKIKFNINEDRNIIDKIQIIAKGYGNSIFVEEGYGGPITHIKNNFTLFAWNHSSSSWGKYLATHSSLSKDTLTIILTSINNYVDDSGNLYVILVGAEYVGGGVNTYSYLYYVEAKVIPK